MFSVNRLVTAVAGLGLALSVAQTSHAAILLSDNFDTDSATTQLNFTGFINWNVDSGTVDYIRSGDFGLECVGDAGGCVDSDGSSGDAGRLVSKAVFNLPEGTSGTLSLMVSGNQRGELSSIPDTVNIGFLFPDSLLPAFSSPCVRAPSDPYSDCSIAYAVVAPISVRVFIEGIGNDNIGALFDDFLFTADIAQVPEPITLALLGIGLAGLGFTRRRRIAN
jgi:hypothetical protein